MSLDNFMMQHFLVIILSILLTVGCASKRSDASQSAPEATADAAPSFSQDSAFSFLKTQVDFGPRVPNSDAHRRAADWMTAKLKSYGASVIEQRADLQAFDGTTLHARNIFAQFNPNLEDRTLLLAHYDCRPWADQDPDPAKRKQPVDGANDGASGVAVLLEIARNIQAQNPNKGIDILFVDAEDWGEENDEDSWALGSKYFVSNPPIDNYFPKNVILLDMVGGKNATFAKEQFSLQANPGLMAQVWSAANDAGYAANFPDRPGGMITDDHVQFINAGIPAIDIIEHHPGSGFNPTWHTTADNIENIDPKTLKAVGQSLLHFLYNYNY